MRLKSAGKRALSRHTVFGRKSCVIDVYIYIMEPVRLYVGGLPYRTTVEAIRAFFAAAGEVADVRIVTERETGRSRGFGFVDMADQAGAEKAIEMFHDQEFEGRRLTVNLARPREDRA
jgi:RNA recognition motif-containing protein